VGRIAPTGILDPDQASSNGGNGEITPIKPSEDVGKNPREISLAVLQEHFEDFKLMAYGEYGDGEDLFMTQLNQTRERIEGTL